MEEKGNHSRMGSMSFTTRLLRLALPLLLFASSPFGQYKGQINLSSSEKLHPEWHPWFRRTWLDGTLSSKRDAIWPDSLFNCLGLSHRNIARQGAVGRPLDIPSRIWKGDDAH